MPVGSQLDATTGVFTWAPGVGFVGAYDLVFVRWDGAAAVARHEVRIILAAEGQRPRRPAGRDRRAALAAGRRRSRSCLAGWAADLDAASGTGIATLHAWAYPLTGGPPVFLGATHYGGARPDVAAVHGEQFASPASASPCRARSRQLRSGGVRVEHGAAGFVPPGTCA